MYGKHTNGVNQGNLVNPFYQNILWRLADETMARCSLNPARWWKWPVKSSSDHTQTREDPRTALGFTQKQQLVHGDGKTATRGK